MEELEAVKLDILEAGRKHGLREILLQSIAKLLEKGKSKEEICELLDVSEKDVDKSKKWQRLLISSANNGNKILHADMSVMTFEMYMELDKRPDPVVSENEELEKMMKDRMLHTITMLRKRTDLSTEDACYLANLYLVEYVFEDLNQVEEDCMERWIDEKNLEPAEEGKINLARIISQVVAHEPIQTAILCKDLFGWELQDALYACDVTEKEWERYLIGTKVPWEYV